MKIRVLGAFGSEGRGQRPSAFLVNDRILVDAGTVTGALTVPEQLEIVHALITHAHFDHIGGLAYLTETLASCGGKTPLRVTAVAPVVDALRASAFNNVVWPDFTKIMVNDQPVMEYRTLVDEAEQRVDDLWVTPVPVSHSVPASGFIIHDGEQGFVYSGDTGPTEALWKAIRGLRRLKAIILECAFPDRLEPLAAAARHMTPSLIQRELDKLPADVPVWIFHVKPQFYDETAEQIDKLGGRVSLVEQDKTYTL
ncbi:MAG: 3',5'-cyclic-nucleotide phosphodiesterase [Candidatus Rokubacteria bacterium]|nr:3',5'-cyclic-nucleotide phosphodiesterase [Candidatus Rokubacteria bacterium]